MEESSATLYHIWLAILIFFLVALFVAKLKFDKLFERREERRRMIAYSKVKLAPNEEGQSRVMRVKRIK